jgi:hypothetical protein
MLSRRARASDPQGANTHPESWPAPLGLPAAKEVEAMRKTCLAAVFAVALSPLAAAAQEHAIKVKQPGLGDKTRTVATSDFKVEFKVLDTDNNVVMEAQETKTNKFVFREVGLERAASGADLVKVKRHYEHAERTVKGVRETLPYQGKTVLIEKKDGKFEFRIEDGEVLEGKDAQELIEEFNKGGLRKLISEHFLPRKAVKVDDSWKFDVAPLAKAFMADGKTEIDETKSTGKGRLLKAYTKHDKPYGVIELTLEFPLTHINHDGNKVPAKDSKMALRLQADTCIDGALDESRIKGLLAGDVRADINANGMDLRLAITIRANVDEHRTLAKK